NTEFLPYVDTLESWVIQLLDAGVKPSRITLVGFSRGSHLTAYASARLKDRGINTALLASCLKGDISSNDAPLVLGGHLLNIYETTDEVGPCDKLASRSQLLSFREIAITTGKQHGAFFQPLPEWIAPLKAWINETNR
ncbi:MAG: alpha/beta hydrolase, partial [Pseudomonadota bacterium]